MPNYSDTSPFVECQAILAAQEADTAELDRLVAAMLPGERQQLADGCHRLINAITNQS